MSQQKDFLNTPLLDEIIKYSSDPKVPFHMPGHAAGTSLHPKLLAFFGQNIFKADLTELDEMDNLHDPKNVIKDTQEKISKIFNSKASYMLINGSTLGLMSLVLSVAREGEKIIIPRNSHRSILNGIILSGAVPVWIMPEWINDWQVFGEVFCESLKTTLNKHSDAKAVIITNPTYEGIVSDTKSLKAICNKYNVPLIVDEAHGGHWQFYDKFPANALSCGADAVVQSTHKSCGSLSQSSLLHISKNSNLNTILIEENLRLLQSTSPSYLLMASLDAATSFLASEHGKICLENIYNNSHNIRQKLSFIENINVLSSNENLLIDPTRLFIKVKGLLGNNLANILENEYKIAIESENNVANLLFLNIGNTSNQIDALYKALSEIACKNHENHISYIDQPACPNMILTPKKAYYDDKMLCSIKDGINKIAAFPISKCPPGTLILTPGELITEHHLQFFDPDEKVYIVSNA